MYKNLVINLLLVVAAVGAGFLLSQKPWQVFQSQRKATQAQLEQMREAEKQYVGDVQVRAKIGTSLGREELARKQGWRKPDEQPLNLAP